VTVTASYVAPGGAIVASTASVTIRSQATVATNAARISVTPKSSQTLPENWSAALTFMVVNSGGTSATVDYASVCSGGVITVCGAPGHSTATIAGNGGQDVVTVSVVTGVRGQTGTVKLVASSAGVGLDTGRVDVTTGITSGAITISIANQLNAGSSIARDRCLTIAAGDGAAYECGDLRLVHALPTTTTMNKARTPTLIYTSAHAHPVTLIAVDVGLDGTINPSQITATVRFSASDTVQQTFSWNGASGQAATRRIVIPKVSNLSGGEAIT